MRRYAVHSMFRTIQGEGRNAGRAAFFVRLAGCNVWNGDPKQRERDTKRGFCAAICDTEFRWKQKDPVTGGTFTAEELLAKIVEGTDNGRRILVITGGEPTLQFDKELADTLAGWVSDDGRIIDINVETNGFAAFYHFAVKWTLSPKPPTGPIPHETVSYTEIKVLYPVEDLDPVEYVQKLLGERDDEFMRHRIRPFLYIQPVDVTTRPLATLGLTELGRERRTLSTQQMVYSACARFIEQNPEWRLSFQVHKALGIE